MKDREAWSNIGTIHDINLIQSLFDKRQFEDASAWPSSKESIFALELLRPFPIYDTTKKNDWLGKKRGCDWSRIRLDSTKWKIWRFGKTTRCGLAVGNQRVSKRKRKYIKFGQLMMRPQVVLSIYMDGERESRTVSYIAMNYRNLVLNSISFLHN